MKKHPHSLLRGGGVRVRVLGGCVLVLVAMVVVRGGLVGAVVGRWLVLCLAGAVCFGGVGGLLFSFCFCPFC